ncbi:MAG: flagellar filament capping protein FliD [Candidatus Poribacteria bacterium]
MALIGSSGTDNISPGSLTLNFLNSLISASLSNQRQPITKLNAQKDQLSIKKAIYSDLKTKLKTLNTIVGDLKDDGDPIFDNKTAISSNNSKLTASVDSTAINGKYTITISNLAQAHSVRSDQQTSSTSALGLDGKFTINGKTITVVSTDTLQNIVNTINNTEFDEGKGVSASIVNNNLILTAQSTGIENQITASDTEGNVLESLGILDGGNFKTTIQDALDASFTVNGISVTKSSNTEVEGVINGVKLNLLSKTDENETITLTVQPDYVAIRAKVSAFVSNLNSTLSYIDSKTKTVANTENKTYTRGALAGDTVFTSLKMNIFSTLRTKVTSSSENDPQYLSDVGITVDTGLNIKLNTSKLDSAVESNMNGVIKLFDTIMGKFEELLEPFITSNESSNTLDSYSKSVNDKIKNIENRVKIMENAIKKKEEMLVKQYSSIYIQNIEFTSQQYSLFSSYYSTKV